MTTACDAPEVEPSAEFVQPLAFAPSSFASFASLSFPFAIPAIAFATVPSFASTVSFTFTVPTLAFAFARL
jgi:hypothetical protein